MRIPWQVARDQKGYAEDRRPNANVDPYVVTRLILETVCGAIKTPAAQGKSSGKSSGKKKPASKTQNKPGKQGAKKKSGK